ncbi:polysaccharide deacetylase family protein [Streptacidiphilus jiangxiensis]|uniref:Polysaccharide deacetylase n=1 Tax=Streptacidiphilus jiangxiensis TaxID=235985 RepID=A0A1H7U8U5_STRJI|nr:polysaccharide deacetylase family protein [Streptacidiphilus jiangxiensis]SEL93500.1 Polysaccharide deacetylase [Streptacidiphilus jiangxiensis]
MRQPTLASPVPLLRARTSRRLAVLTFREVRDRGVFAAQLDRVLKSATPVSAGQVQRAMSGGAPLPPHSVLITFEHGHRDVVTQALPVLAARAVPAVVFAVAGLVDTDDPYWWDEAEFLVGEGGWARSLSGRAGGSVAAALAALPDPDRRRSLAELRVTARHRTPSAPQLTSADLHLLLDAGISVGNHGLDHARLDRCDDYTLREEVRGGHDRLAKLTGVPITSFAYPDDVHDLRAVALLRELGYGSAFRNDGRLVDPTCGLPDQLCISRIRVEARTARARLDAALSAWAPATSRRLRGAEVV